MTLTGFALVGTLAFAFVVTMVVAGCLGVAIERLALRPMRAVRGTAAMITTIGVSYILFNAILLTVGAELEELPQSAAGLALGNRRRDLAAAGSVDLVHFDRADDRACTSSSTAPGSARRCGQPRKTPRRRG